VPKPCPETVTWVYGTATVGEMLVITGAKATCSVVDVEPAAVVVQRGRQRSARFLRGRTIHHSRYGLEYAEEHLYAAVAVREQAGGVSKVVSPCSNLNRHGLRLQTALISAVTKVTAIRGTVCDDQLACGLHFLLARRRAMNSR
jgi:hypothetical protein